MVALLIQARNGDDTAIRELLRRYRPLLALTVRRSYLSHQAGFLLFDADDLWQEARYAFLLAVRRYDATRRIPFGGYLKSLLPWHFHDLQRRIERRLTVSLDEVYGDTVPDPAADFVSSVVPRDLLAHLPPRQAHVLDAIYVSDRSIAAIARDLDVTPRAVERMRRRAMVRHTSMTGPISATSLCGAQAIALPLGGMQRQSRTEQLQHLRRYSISVMPTVEKLNPAHAKH